jgi:hypothetical protein
VLLQYYERVSVNGVGTEVTESPEWRLASKPFTKKSQNGTNCFVAMADAEARKKQLEDMKKKLADMKKSREQGWVVCSSPLLPAHFVLIWFGCTFKLCFALLGGCVDSAAASEAVAGVTVPVAIGSPPVAPPVRIGNDSVTQAKGIEDLDDYLAGVLGEKPGFEPSKPPSSASTPHPIAVQPPRLTLSQLTLVWPARLYFYELFGSLWTTSLPVQATNIGSMICLPKQVEMYNKETMTDDMTGMSSPHAHHRHRSTGSETGFDSIAKRKGRHVFSVDVDDRKWGLEEFGPVFVFLFPAELFPETPFASVSPDKGQLGEDDDDSGAITPAAAEAVLLSPEFQVWLSAVWLFPLCDLFSEACCVPLAGVLGSFLIDSGACTCTIRFQVGLWCHRWLFSGDRRGLAAGGHKAKPVVAFGKAW